MSHRVLLLELREGIRSETYNLITLQLGKVLGGLCHFSTEKTEVEIF